MSAFVNLPLHHKVQRFFTGTGSPGKRAVKGLCVCVLPFISEIKIIEDGEWEERSEDLRYLNSESQVAELQKAIDLLEPQPVVVHLRR